MSNDFKFEYGQAPQNKISNPEILNSLKEFYEVIGKSFTTTEYNEWSSKLCHSNTVMRRFGTWRKALESAGIEEKVEGKYTTKELLDNLELVWRELGTRPSRRNISKYGYGISERPYKDRWGSLNEVCRLFSEYMSGNITEQRLLLLNENKRKRRNISLKDRWFILKRDNYQCVKCGLRPPEVTLEIDHILPFAKGGLDSVQNLQTLCNYCNQGKKDRL